MVENCLKIARDLLAVKGFEFMEVRGLEKSGRSYFPAKRKWALIYKMQAMESQCQCVYARLFSQSYIWEE